MRQDVGFKVVTIDEGDGPVRAIKDPGGRIMTTEQVDAIRQKQEADLAQATDVRSKLLAKDLAATEQVVAQVRDGLARQIAALDRQRVDLTAALGKLEAGNEAAIADVVKRTADQLARRIDWIGAARDRSVQVLDQVAGKPVNTPATPGKGN